jgi:nuclear GTP-binding protein
VPKEVAQAWLKYLREELPTVAFKCSTQKGSVSTRSGKETFDGSSADCLGSETLLQVRCLLHSADVRWRDARGCESTLI